MVINNFQIEASRRRINQLQEYLGERGHLARKALAIQSLDSRDRYTRNLNTEGLDSPQAPLSTPGRQAAEEAQNNIDAAKQILLDTEASNRVGEADVEAGLISIEICLDDAGKQIARLDVLEPSTLRDC